MNMLKRAWLGAKVGMLTLGIPLLCLEEKR